MNLWFDHFVAFWSVVFIFPGPDVTGPAPTECAASDPSIGIKSIGHASKTGNWTHSWPTKFESNLMKTPYGRTLLGNHYFITPLMACHRLPSFSLMSFTTALGDLGIYRHSSGMNCKKRTRSSHFDHLYGHSYWSESANICRQKLHYGFDIWLLPWKLMAASYGFEGCLIITCWI